MGGCRQSAIFRISPARLLACCGHQYIHRDIDLEKLLEARGIRDAVVAIDEIQKNPTLMDEVHLMIEERGIRFLLTGSSARSLKRSGVSLLGGRGSDRRMHVFTWHELQTSGFDLFFDPGVVRSLRRIPVIHENASDFGDFFEHFIFLELRAWIDYRSPRMPLCYWRSTSGFEVDFLLDGTVAIEVKAASTCRVIARPRWPVVY